MRVKALIAAILLAFAMQSCNIINPAEKVPTFVRLDSIRVTTDSLVKTGTPSSKISSAWVYVNNDIVGVYDLPASIPLLIDANASVAIAPGINYTGLKDYQSIYPFYT